MIEAISFILFFVGFLAAFLWAKDYRKQRRLKQKNLLRAERQAAFNSIKSGKLKPIPFEDTKAIVQYHLTEDELASIIDKAEQRGASSGYIDGFTTALEFSKKGYAFHVNKKHVSATRVKDGKVVRWLLSATRRTIQEGKEHIEEEKNSKVIKPDLSPKTINHSSMEEPPDDQLYFDWSREV